MKRRRIRATIRRRVATASQHRCAYCHTSQSIIGPLLQIDHILPESLGGTDDEENLTLACPLCNSHKSDRREGTDPESGETVRWFNPRVDTWNSHFGWTQGGTSIMGRTAIGRATAVALEMNHPDMIEAWRGWVSVGWHPPEEDEGS